MNRETFATDIEEFYFREARKEDANMIQNSRSLISLAEIPIEDILKIAERSLHLAMKGSALEQTLCGTTVGTIFGLTSTRTRTSFNLGAMKLGGYLVNYTGNELQFSAGESLSDTMRVLGGFLDIVVVRDLISNESLKLLSQETDISIVNAMSTDEHPSQAINDLAVMHNHFGSLKGLKVLYVGEGNSTAVALALSAARIEGFELFVITPTGYGLPDPVLNQLEKWKTNQQGSVITSNDINIAPSEVDVVYTTKWQTTGTRRKDKNWKDEFAPLKVDSNFLDMRMKTKSVFMHDLPAIRDEEVTSEVLDGPRSIAFEQAHHKLYSAMAILEWCSYSQK